MDDNPIISWNSHTLSLPFRLFAVEADAQRCGIVRRRRVNPSWMISPAAILGLFILFLLTPGVALCRIGMRQIRGRVVDASTNKGLPFANILVENTEYRASTNASGDFRVLLPPGGSKLVVSYVGYETTFVKAQHAGSKVLVRLSPVGYVAHEVEVIATRGAERMQSSFSLGRAEIADFAGITRDPMRAVQLMPGVSTDDEASAKMDVRGGTWDENTVLIDGAEIYDPYHLKEVSIASLGIFNEDVVRSINFSSGGFGARYGDALSSVMDIHYREGNRKHFEGSVNLSPLDLSASLEGPVGRKLSYIVAGRGSYLGYMLKTLDLSPYTSAGYYDVQGDIAYHPGETGRIQLDFLYSNDAEEQSPHEFYSMWSSQGTVRGTKTMVSRTATDLLTFVGHYSNSLLSLTYRRLIGDNLSNSLLLYYTGNTGNENPVASTSIGVQYGALPQLWSNYRVLRSERYDFVMNTFSLGDEIRYQPFPFLSVEAGAGVKRVAFNYVPDMFSRTVSENNVAAFPDTTFSLQSSGVTYEDTTRLDADTYELNAFIQQRVKVTDDFEITPGIRFDYFDLDREGRLSPRVNFRYLVPLGIGLTGAWGIYYQIPQYDQVRMSASSDSNTQFQESTQYIVGIEKKVAPGIGMRIEFYQKYYSHLIPAIRTPYGGLFYTTKRNDGTGFAKGIDFQYSMKLNDVSLWISYGYLVAKEKSGGDPNYYPRLSDQRNTASLDITYRPWKDWTVDLRGIYGSGYAYTPEIAVYDSVTMLGEWVEGSPNSAHYPPYERVDIRIAKAFVVAGSPLQLYVDVTNILDRKNIWAIDYTYDAEGNLSAQPLTLLGVVPAIGVSYRFGL